MCFTLNLNLKEIRVLTKETIKPSIEMLVLSNVM